jgi:hypothetical protein
VLAGALLLLSNLGYLPWGFWETAWRFWPVILILIGIETIVLGRGRWGAVGAAIGLIIVVTVIGAIAYVTPWASRIESANAWNLPAFHINVGNGEFGPMISGSGNIISENKGISEFKEVDVSGPFVTEIVAGNNFETTITADDNLMQYIQVEKQDEALRIRLNNVSVVGNSTLKVRIVMPELKGIELSGAAKANVSGFESIRDFEAKLSGASRLDGTVNSNTTILTLSGASACGIKGSANSLEVRISGASKMDMQGFSAKNASIRSSGASNCTITVNERLDAEVSGGSAVNYFGNPSLGRTNVSGGARLEHK